MKEKRGKIWIDPFQTGLIMRIIAYCAFYQIALLIYFAVCEQAELILASMGMSWFFISNPVWRGVFALVLILIPAAMDALFFAHRFVGPVFRFRAAVRDIASGKPVSMIQLRKNDMLTEFRDEFNAMLEQLAKKGAIVITSTEPNKTPPPASQTQTTGVLSKA
ncbi:MAG: hypothetical protein ACJ8C4_02035 [Gemmataceae bacterium]